ncbi:MAG: tetratricopeptide repeat protein [Acidobacteria bacterium]|nr:tetratricopeptide repeat protein [Acidobacteriota bacterium]
MAYLNQLVRFCHDPLGAAVSIRSSRPVGVAFFTALGATVLYGFVLGGLPRDLMQLAQLGSRDVGAISILFHHIRGGMRALVPIVFLVGVYVPVTLLILGALIPRDRPRDLLRREFGASVATSLSAWAAVFLVWSVLALLLADPYRPRSVAIWTMSPIVGFVVPYVIGFAPIPGAGFWRAALAAFLATPSLALLPVAAWASYLAMSPFVLIILFFIFRGVWRDWSSTRDARLRYEQNLKAATLNEADSEAHLNLGIVLEERGEIDEAAERYRTAIRINPDEADAHYRLGRIARRAGRYAEAIDCFNRVVGIDENHAQHEIWREVGATYLEAGQLEDAVGAFERYVSTRSTDAEGLFLLGIALSRLRRYDEAREQMLTVVEIVNSAPAFKFRQEQRWLHEAEAYLKQNESQMRRGTEAT